MDEPLNYQSLRCVLEYLEANKRIYICTRNPTLRKIERKISLHVDSLTFAYSSITLNEVTFQLYSRVRDRGGCYQNVPYAPNRFGIRDYSTDRILLPGDIPLRSSVSYTRTESTSSNRQTQPIYLKFEIRTNRHVPPNHRVPKHLEFHVALKRLATFLLGARSQIIVKHLEVVDDLTLEILRLPPGLKLKTQELAVYSIHLQNMIPLIDSKKLKSLKLNWCNWNDPCFELPIVRSVQKLYIKGAGLNDTSWYKTLLKLQNRDITIYRFSSIEMKEFVQKLLKEGKDIGTCYTIENTVFFPQWFKDIGKQFGVEAAEKFHRNRNYTSFSLAIPMCASSELRIRGIDEKRVASTKIEVVPIIPEKKWSNGCWTVVFLIFVSLIALIVSKIFVMFTFPI